jgi:PST family polysaccharide transporter
MLSFSIWSMIEAVSIWLTNYVDIFIVGSLLSSYYLGIYRTSMTTVAQIVGIVTSITTPILFSALSRLQSDKNEFQKLFFKFQKIVGMLVIPLGFGIFLFSDLIVQILLGPQWIEASSFIGLWGLTSSVTVVLSHYSSEVYRAKGKPKVSVLAQFLHIVVLLPVVFIFAKESFQQLCVARSLIRLELVLVNMVLMLIIVKISPLKMIVNIFPALMSSTFMLGTILLLPENDNVIMRFVYVFVAIVVYFSTLYFFPKERYLMIELIKNKVFGRVRRFRKNSE